MDSQVINPDSLIREPTLSRRQYHFNLRNERRKARKEKIRKGRLLNALFIPVQLFSLVYLAYTLPHRVFLDLGVGLVLVVFLFFTLASSRGFGVLVSVLIGLGFFLVGGAWINNWSISFQLSAILVHFFIFIFLLTTWFQAYTIRNLVDALFVSTREIERLRKLDSDGLLTKNEFMYRLEDLIVGMNRRGEHGFLLIVDLVSVESYAINSIVPSVSRILLNSVRTKYDLVGSLGDLKLAVALQNVTPAGCNVVLDRFKSYVSNELGLSVVGMLSIYSIPLQDISSPILRGSGSIGASFAEQ